MRSKETRTVVRLPARSAGFALCVLAAVGAGAARAQEDGHRAPSAPANQPGNSKTETNSRPEAGEPLTLPGYELLADPDYQRELRLSAAQVKRLIEISAKFTTGIQKSGRDLQRAWDSTGRKTAVPQDLVRQLQQATQDLENAATREVEAVLSAEQLARYKALARERHAYEWLWWNYANVRGPLGITKRQDDELRRLRNDLDRQTLEEQQKFDKSCLGCDVCK